MIPVKTEEANAMVAPIAARAGAVQTATNAADAAAPGFVPGSGTVYVPDGTGGVLNMPWVSQSKGSVYFPTAQGTGKNNQVNVDEAGYLLTVDPQSGKSRRFIGEDGLPVKARRTGGGTAGLLSVLFGGQAPVATPQSTTPAATGSATVITSQAQYNALPSGSIFTWNGKRGKKP